MVASHPFENYPIVSCLVENELRWGFQVSDNLIFIDGALWAPDTIDNQPAIMAPYPKPSVNLIPGGQLTEWETYIESKL
jgi:hypothetical protein